MINKNLENLMNIQPETLAQSQHIELKKFVLSVLNDVRLMIENEDYEKIIGSDDGDIIFHSPSGDGYGCDNYCINFAYEQGKYVDIEDIVTKLNNLKEISERYDHDIFGEIPSKKKAQPKQTTKR